jgi:hypothetical protein
MRRAEIQFIYSYREHFIYFLIVAGKSEAGEGMGHGPSYP